jgi:hypothetical protein
VLSISVLSFSHVLWRPVLPSPPVDWGSFKKAGIYVDSQPNTFLTLWPSHTLP